MHELERLAVRNNSYRAHHKLDRFKEHVMIYYTSYKSGDMTSSGVQIFNWNSRFYLCESRSDTRF